MPYDLLVGVDIGGTHIRVLARGGGRTRRLSAPAPPLADLPDSLRRLWRRWRLRPRNVAALVVAAKGVWTPAERRAEAQRLRGLARRVRVISDAEAAYLGALGNGPGVLILSGTGSIVLGRNRRGRWARAGGLGPLLGDEGSAFWLGSLWLRITSRNTTREEERLRKIARSPDAVARIAAIAPGILGWARGGAGRKHQAAREFVRGAQNVLAAYACLVARDLKLERPVPVSWAGSLMGNDFFRAGVLLALQEQGLKARPTPPAGPPVEAAQALARRLTARRR